MKAGSRLNHLFVYGSLRQGSSHKMASWLADNARFVCAGSIPGHLFLIDWYPGFVQDPTTRTHVVGDIYKLSDQDGVIEELDLFEGCSLNDQEPFEFVRMKTEVTTNAGETLACWIYHYNGVTDEFRRIESGDFMTFKRVS